MWSGTITDWYVQNLHIPVGFGFFMSRFLFGKKLLVQNIGDYVNIHFYLFIYS